jgi:hypothetical protein
MIEKKDRFVERRRWSIPRKAFIIVKVPTKNCEKLKGWLDKRENVGYHFDNERRELLILNITKLNRRARAKKALEASVAA